MSLNTPLEDSFEDIIAKAQAGLRLSDAELSHKSGLTEIAICALKTGQFDEQALPPIATALQLDAPSLIELAQGAWFPKTTPPQGLIRFNTPFPGYEAMTVNAYLVFDLKTRAATVFDTGADASGIIETIQAQSLQLEQILITHAHRDHINDLTALKQATGAPASTFEKESVAGATPFESGTPFHCGGLSIHPIETSGHSIGGTSYLITGLTKPVAIVGDALFAGSVGGAATAWEGALSMIRQNLLSLPDETILCPGHGPLTTVAQEKAHNPIFPEFK